MTSWRLGLCDVGFLACWLVGLFVFVRLHVDELAPSHVDLLTDWRVGLSACLLFGLLVCNHDVSLACVFVPRLLYCWFAGLLPCEGCACWLGLRV